MRRFARIVLLSAVAILVGPHLDRVPVLICVGSDRVESAFRRCSRVLWGHPDLARTPATSPARYGEDLPWKDADEIIRRGRQPNPRFRNGPTIEEAVEHLRENRQSADEVVE
jgi:hypothetical protein